MSHDIKAAKVAPCRPEDEILVVIPHYWGKGKTLADAIKKVESAGGKIGVYWRIYSAHPASSLDEMGFINYPKLHAPVKLAESNPTKQVAA